MTSRSTAGALGLCAALAAWASVAAGAHAHHQGDSLVPALTSLQQWTFFYWEQNRYGMLIPLLTRPLSDPLWTLVAQHALSSFFGLLAFFATARAVLGRDGPWLAAGALGAAAFLGTQHEYRVFIYLSVVQPAGTSLALGALALCLWNEPGAERRGRGRLAVAFGLVLLATWVNVALVFFLLPALLVPRLLDRHGPTRTPVPELSTLAAFGIVYAATRLHPHFHEYAPLPVAEWPRHGLDFGIAVWRHFVNDGLHYILLVLALLTGIATRGASGLPWARAAGVAAGALAYLAVFAVLAWTHAAPRYALLPLAALAPTFAAIPVLRWLGTGRRRVAANVLACGLLAAAIAAKTGPPAPGAIRADLDRTLGEATPELLASGVRQVLGSYWKIWPMVFHANLVLHEQGSGREIHGVGQRALPTITQWGPDLPCGVRVASRSGDRNFAWAHKHGLLSDRRLELEEAGETIDLFRVVCAP